MTVTLQSIRAIPATALFTDIYGGADNIPAEIRRPASHFQAIPRIGQYCTFVVCEASDGTVGYGECFGLPTPHSAAAIINDVAADALIGSPLGPPSQMTASLKRFFLALGHSKGPAMEALSGIDIALWDLTARRDGCSLTQLLGAKPGPSAAYASPIPFLPTPEATARAATEIAAGFTAVKLKIGRGVVDDIPHIAAAREAIGVNKSLMLDANCGYDLAAAMTLVKEIAPLGIAWLEEPLPADDLSGLRALAEASDIPLAGGENEFTPNAFVRLIEEGGLDILQPNITRCGGVSGLLEIDRIASEGNVTVAPHGVGGCIAVAATLHTSRAMSSFRIFEVNKLPNPLRDEVGSPATITPEGAISPPEGPGHGSLLDDRINRFAGPMWQAAE